MLRKKLQILFVVDILAVGGSEMFLLRKIQKLRERGHFAALAYSEKRGSKIDYYLQQYLQNQQLYELSHGQKSIQPLLKELQPEILHTVQAHPRFLSLGKEFDSSLVCVSTVTGNIWKADRLFDHREYTDAIVTKSEVFLTIIRNGLRKPPGTIRVIQNGIALDQENTGQLSLPASVPTGKKIILHIARLHPDKNIEDSMTLAAELFENRSDCVFLLAGAHYGELGGRYFRKLSKLNRKLGLTNRYFFLGERHDIPALLQASECVVNTTKVHEGTPNALLETLSAGRPVVALRCPGIEDVVQHDRTGFIVDDLSSAVLCVHKLLDHPDLNLEMGKAARKFAEERFDINRSITEYEDLYYELLGGKNDLNKKRFEENHSSGRLASR